jgi:hypothetical protein
MTLSRSGGFLDLDFEKLRHWLRHRLQILDGSILSELEGPLSSRKEGIAVLGSCTFLVDFGGAAHRLQAPHRSILREHKHPAFSVWTLKQNRWQENEDFAFDFETRPVYFTLRDTPTDARKIRLSCTSMLSTECCVNGRVPKTRPKSLFSVHDKQSQKGCSHSLRMLRWKVCSQWCSSRESRNSQATEARLPLNTRRSWPSARGRVDVLRARPKAAMQNSQSPREKDVRTNRTLCCGSSSWELTWEKKQRFVAVSVCLKSSPMSCVFLLLLRFVSASFCSCFLPFRSSYSLFVSRVSFVSFLHPLFRAVGFSSLLAGRS